MQVERPYGDGRLFLLINGWDRRYMLYMIHISVRVAKAKRPIMWAECRPLDVVVGKRHAMQIVCVIDAPVLWL